MKRKMVAMLMTAAMVAGMMTGCGGGSSEAPASEPAASEAPAEEEAAPAEEEAPAEEASTGEKVKITWLHHFQEEGLANWVNATVEKFMEQNPDIEVTVEAVLQDSFQQTLRTKIASDDAPMVFDLANLTDLQEFVASGQVVDLGELTENCDLNPEILKNGNIDGVQYGVSLDMNAYSFFYNKDVFEKCGIEVPQTWDELIAACETMKSNGIVPFASGFQEQWTLQTAFQDINIPMTGPKDSNWWTDKMSLATKFSDDETFKKSIELFYQLKPYWGDDPFGTNWDSAQSMLATGEAGIIANGSWTIDGCTSKNPDVRLGTFALPAIPGVEGMESPLMFLWPGSTYVLYNTDDEAKLAAGKKLIGYLMSKENGDTYAQQAKKLSAAKGVDFSFSEALMDILSYDNAWNCAGVSFMNGEYATIYFDTITQYMMEDTLDVDALCADLDDQFAAAGA